MGLQSPALLHHLSLLSSNYISSKTSWKNMPNSKKPTKPSNSKEPQNLRMSTTSPTTTTRERFSDEETLEIREKMLEWYDENRRELPWRDHEDENEERRAYRVWVSEVMLQQTRVQTVVDYYNRWMIKWPTIHHLSSASLEEVNELWAGLGYYRRARYLLEGAKMIASEGEFPRTVNGLRKVPGIGDYTAGAIASIAFNKVVPVVDGNVVRVLSRLKAISANPKDSTTIKHFWKLADQLVDSCRPGDFNQSLMELGATLCTPLNPLCSSCPVSKQCRAFSLSKSDVSVHVTDYPTKSTKTKQRHDFSVVCVVEIMEDKEVLQGDLNESAFILVKRPEEGLLAGLWEFPNIILDKEADLTTRKEITNRFLKKSFKLDPGKTCSIVLREYVGELIHVFSHIRRKIYVELLVLHLKGGIDDISREMDNDTTWKCVDGEALLSMGLTSGVRKVYNMVRKYKQKMPSTHSSEQVPCSRKKSSKQESGKRQR